MISYTKFTRIGLWCGALTFALGACGGSTPGSNPNEPSATSSAVATGTNTAPAEPAAAAVAANDLVGSWSVEDGDFEEITLEADGTWSSFLHQRPFYAGIWTFADGTLSLVTADGDDSMKFSGLSMAGAVLSGQWAGAAASWTRIDAN